MTSMSAAVTLSWNGPFVMLAVIIVILFTAVVLTKRGQELAPLVYIIPCSVICGFVMSRIVYVTVCDSLYLDNKEKWLLTDGGYSLLGAVVGVLAAVIISCLIANRRKYILPLLDAMAPATALAIAVGRFGSVFSEDCLGAVVSNPKLQYFPIAICTGSGAYRYAVFFYEAVCCILIFAVLAVMMKKAKRGQLTVMFFILYCGVRTFLESIRSDSMYVGFVRISQVAAAMTLFAIYLYYLIRTVKFIRYHLIYILYHIIFFGAFTAGFVTMFKMGSQLAVTGTVLFLISCLLMTASAVMIYFTYIKDSDRWQKRIKKRVKKYRAKKPVKRTSHITR